MKHISMKRVCAALAGLAVLTMATAADAAHPASVAGRWNATANQTLGALTIVQPVSAATCKPISGTIFTNPIQGYYCPATGRIVFVRRTGSVVQTPIQLYEGHVSHDAVIDRIGGSFIVWNAAGGGGVANEGVDYNFSAFK